VPRFTVTPGSIVKGTPLPTAVGPVRLKGLFACVQVVSALSIPVTSVEACTVPTGRVLNKISPLATRMLNKNPAKNGFLYTTSPRITSAVSWVKAFLSRFLD
jgi:hypothetical protein